MLLFLVTHHVLLLIVDILIARPSAKTQRTGLAGAPSFPSPLCIVGPPSSGPDSDHLIGSVTRPVKAAGLLAPPCRISGGLCDEAIRVIVLCLGPDRCGAVVPGGRSSRRCLRGYGDCD